MPLYANQQAWIDGIREWLDVDIAEYTDARLGEFLYLGEETLNRRVRNRHTELFTTAVIGATDAGAVTFPSDFQEMRSVHLEVTGDAIDTVSPAEFFKLKVQGDTQNDTPIVYMMVGRVGYFYPYGAGSSLSIIYYRKIPHLVSGSVETNIFTDEFSDALLYAALSAAAPYMIDDVRINMWRSELDRVIGEVNALKHVEHMGNAPLRRRINLR
jgi:hypothetical protein